MDSGIGPRIREIRQRRRLTLRATAELAGRSHAWLSLIEQGKRTLDRRSDIDALAAALKVSPTELLAQPYAPVDQSDAEAQEQMEAIRIALVSTDLEYPSATAQREPLEHTVLAVQAAHAALCRRGDVAAAGRALPDLLTALHVYATGGREDQRRTALGAVVEACCATVGVAKALGYHDLAWIGAERGRQAAHRLGDPMWTGLSEFYMSYALRPYSLGAANTARALATMPPTGPDPRTPLVYGMLQMMAAFGAAVTGRDDDMRSHLAEAEELAARTGDTSDFELYFGPSNIAIWRLTMAVERGEGGAGLEKASDVRLDAVSRRRQAAYFVDLGRAQAQGRQDHDALRSLLWAEHLMPQELHSNVFARQAIAEMYRRARARAGGSDLRSLATRVGVDVS